MNNKDQLISLAIKYAGNYESIKKAILKNEKIKQTCNHNCLTIFDKDYPLELFDLAKPPLVLFYKGNINLLKKDKISIVGSRFPSDYAMKITSLYVNKIKNDTVIISGLAKGIDACAHLNAKMTIGILGCGIDYIYPKENFALYKKIEKEGLLLSEYPSLIEPKAYHFPFRNRIIAALGKELIVMEAKNKSGTLTTINEALILGKNIKVLPFQILDERGKFNNYLIQEGAEILKYEDIN